MTVSKTNSNRKPESKSEWDAKVDAFVDALSDHMNAHPIATILLSIVFLILGVICILGGLALVEIQSQLISAVSFILIVQGLVLVLLHKVCINTLEEE